MHAAHVACTMCDVCCNLSDCKRRIIMCGLDARVRTSGGGLVAGVRRSRSVCGDLIPRINLDTTRCTTIQFCGKPDGSLCGKVSMNGVMQILAPYYVLSVRRPVTLLHIILINGMPTVTVQRGNVGSRAVWIWIALKKSFCITHDGRCFESH